jgi:hypothetical protein
MDSTFELTPEFAAINNEICTAILKKFKKLNITVNNMGGILLFKINPDPIFSGPELGIPFVEICINLDHVVISPFGQSEFINLTLYYADPKQFSIPKILTHMEKFYKNMNNISLIKDINKVSLKYWYEK